MSCYDGVAVRAGAEHREVIDEFLRYLLSDACQRQTEFIARRDLIEDGIEIWKGADGVSEGHLWLGNGREKSFPLKPDGTTYLEEYFAFLDNCRPVPVEAEGIKNIVYEEAGACFNGDKSVEDVADIIQNRAQLYLDERNW